MSSTTRPPTGMATPGSSVSRVAVRNIVCTADSIRSDSSTAPGTSDRIIADGGQLVRVLAEQLDAQAVMSLVVVSLPGHQELRSRC